MKTKFFLRNSEAIAFSSANLGCFFLIDERQVSFTGHAAPIVRRVFDLVSLPTSGEAILLGLPGVAEKQVCDILSQLVQGHIIFEGTEWDMQSMWAELDRPRTYNPCDHLIVGVSGAVQAVDLPAYLDPLYHCFCNELQIILTEAALNFVNPRALEYLYGRAPWVDGFAPRGDITVPHIQLARWADLVVIVPASAHTIYRLASGACSDLLSLVVTATRAPVVMVPAMNSLMWSHPAVQRNVEQLRADGIWIIEPGFGYEVSPDSDMEAYVGPTGVSPAGLLSVLVTMWEQSHEE